MHAQSDPSWKKTRMVRGRPAHWENVTASSISDDQLDDILEELLVAQYVIKAISQAAPKEVIPSSTV